MDINGLINAIFTFFLSSTDPRTMDAIYRWIYTNLAAYFHLNILYIDYTAVDME